MKEKGRSEDLRYLADKANRFYLTIASIGFAGFILTLIAGSVMYILTHGC